MKKMITIFLILFSSATYSTAFTMSSDQAEFIVPNLALIESGKCFKLIEQTKTDLEVLDGKKFSWFLEEVILSNPKVMNFFDSKLQEYKNMDDQMTIALTCITLINFLEGYILNENLTKAFSN